jgi:hypothetical protein
MVSPFGTQGRKVRLHITFGPLVFSSYYQAEFAIPPGIHAEDLAYEVSKLAHFVILRKSIRLIFYSSQLW